MKSGKGQTGMHFSMYPVTALV